MGKYQEIVGGSWEQRSVFGESVPHLLHYDMAYLWVLEQQRDQRPQTWLTRVEAWKVLLRFFFLDQVVIAPDDLRTPLLEYADRFGIRRVTWLRHAKSGHVLGVLSPTVIVRPLPDFDDAELDRWRADLKDNEKDFEHLVYVAIKDLISVATNPYALRIANIFNREFEPAESTQRPPAGRAVTVPLLQRLTWEKRDGDLPPVGAVSLAIRAGSGREINDYIPRCLSCNALLLRQESDEPIEVDSNTVPLICSNPQCPSPDQTQSLDLFGIWVRNSDVIVWDPERLPPMADLRLPPDPRISGNEILYEWNKAVIGGEPLRRFLRLRFPDRQVREVALGSIFFDRLVVPGRAEQFRGSGVLPEWTDAVDTSAPAVIRSSPEHKQIEFRGLKIHGWPVRFSRFYKELSLQFEPEIAVGVFPDPSLVGPQWNWFRAFAHGPETALQKYEVTTPNGQRVLTWVTSHEAGLPRSVSLRSVKDPSTGVSFIPERREREETYGGTAAASMAIDFGTTNSLVYFQPPGTGYVARPDTHGLSSRHIAENVLWLADSGSWKESEIIASFLPGPNYRPQAADRFIVPSEMWRVGREGFHLIRWGGNHPDGKNAKPLTQFKWDPPDLGEEGHAPTRLAYLREVFLQFLPVVMKAYDPARIGDLRIGVAFPLAFENASRSRYLRLLQNLTTEIARLTGIQVRHLYSVNESKAAVNAFGRYNDETFLVADMGGGTLDVAFFSFEPSGNTYVHQMGSLRYAGEQCVTALGAQMAPAVDVMQIRDAIARSESPRLYGTQAAEKLATQFSTIAFEFLRTMVAAYRTTTNRHDELVRLVLIGNGWHLVDALSTESLSKGNVRVYQETFSGMIRAIGDENLRFHDDEPLPQFPSSKHLVVAGALQNVTSQNAAHELNEPQVAFAKLPAGRSLMLGDILIPWFDLVGEGKDLPGDLSLAAVDVQKMEIKLKEGPPPPSKAWQTRFAVSVGVRDGDEPPYPPTGELNREIKNSLAGGSQPKMRRGPLQVILEVGWSQCLRQKRGSVL